MTFSLLLTAFLLFELTKASVVLAYDGKEKTIATHSKTIGDVLKEQDIKLRIEDKVSPSLNTKIKDDMTIKLDLAKKITLSIDKEKKEVWTTANTVNEFIQEQKVALHSRDIVNPEKDKKIKRGMEISITKAVPVKYIDNKVNTEVWTPSATVSDFLNENKVVLGELDRVEPKIETPITKSMEIKVVHVEKVTDVVEEQTNFSTVSKKDNHLPKGTEKVIQKGERGLIKKHYKVIKENGKEVSRELINQEIIKEPKDHIVAVGMKVITNQVSRSVPEGGKEFYVTATAYTANCSGCTGITATGFNLKGNPNAKIIAVDPRVIPLGSKVWVEGYGYATASDTGSAIKGHKIDLFVSSESQANQFGRKTVRIQVLN